MRHVTCCSVDGDDGKTILVLVCCTKQSERTVVEAYASKDQQHAGWIREGRWCPEEPKRKEDADKIPKLSEKEISMVMRAAQALRNVIVNVHGF